MRLFYYYTEDIKNKTIIKNEVSVDEKTFKDLFNTIKCKRDHYDHLAFFDHRNEPSDIARAGVWSELMSLYFDISDWIKGKPRKSFIEIYNRLVGGIVEKKLKNIHYEIKKLMAFDSEIEEHYQMLFNCISIKTVGTLSIDEINRVKSFFELGSSDTMYCENDKVRKIGTFPSKNNKKA